MTWRKWTRFRPVSEEEAEGRTLEIFHDIRQTLGVPHTNVLFQAYAGYPDFLDLHWRALKPAIETHEFFRLAARLGAEAYTRIYNYFEVPDLGEYLAGKGMNEPDRKELSRVADLFYYNDAILLLITSIQMQAFDGRVGLERQATVPAQHPVFCKRPMLVTEEPDDPAVRKIFEEMRRTLGIPFLNSTYRAYGRWPEFLARFWQVLRKLVKSPVYIESQTGVADTAWALAREIPCPVELTVTQLIEAGLDDEDVNTLVRTTELFFKTLSGLVLHAAVGKIGLEGGTAKPCTLAEAAEAPPERPTVEAESQAGPKPEGERPGRAA